MGSFASGERLTTVNCDRGEGELIVGLLFGGRRFQTVASLALRVICVPQMVRR